MPNIRTAATLHVASLAIDEGVALRRIADELYLLLRASCTNIEDADTVLRISQSFLLSPLFAMERCRVNRCKD